MEFIYKFLKDILTGLDGESYDVGRVLLVVAFLVGLGLTVYCTIVQIPFNLEQYGIGIGSLLMGGGGALLLKARTEPPHPGDNSNDIK